MFTKLLPQTFREALLLTGYAWFALFVMSIMARALPGWGLVLTPPAFFAALLVISSAFTVAHVFAEAEYDTQHPIDEDEGTTVDPWALQKELMTASGQHIPTDGYFINNGSVLYIALTLEEVAETVEAMLDVMAKDVRAHAGGSLDQAYSELYRVRNLMQVASRSIRKSLESMEQFELPMTIEQARPVADGVTDVVVVTAGLTLSCGFPGAACYMEVVGSNLSKRNPATGKIDKTPDGKWIKGSDYAEPNLDQVLMNHADGFESFDFGRLTVTPNTTPHVDHYLQPTKAWPRT
jgi:hypothetical protein